MWTTITPCQLWTSRPTLDPLTSNTIILLIPFPTDFYLWYVLHSVQHLTRTPIPAPSWPMFVSKTLTLYPLLLYSPFNFNPWFRSWNTVYPTLPDPPHSMPIVREQSSLVGDIESISIPFVILLSSWSLSTSILYFQPVPLVSYFYQ